jgi:signal transduction histidine kinase
VIRGNLEGVLDGVLPANSETLVPVHEQALLLSRLVDDLRELALAEAGQLVLERKPLDVRPLLESVTASLQPEAQAAGTELALDVDVSTPRVLADGARVRQILLNLLSNALRHTPPGGRIVVAAQPEGRMVRFSVSDTGPGIPGDELPHVFERYYRGDPSRARRTGGSGLGLAIVKQLVEAHGGQVTARSGPQGGATLEFTLPGAEQGAQ